MFYILFFSQFRHPEFFLIYYYFQFSTLFSVGFVQAQQMVAQLLFVNKIRAKDTTSTRF